MANPFPGLVVLSDPRAPPVPTLPTETHPTLSTARGNTHVIWGTCWTQCLLPSRRAGRERGEGREQCVADSHVRLARWLPVGRVGHTEAGIRGPLSAATPACPTGPQPSLRPALHLPH